MSWQLIPEEGWHGMSLQRQDLGQEIAESWENFGSEGSRQESLRESERGVIIPWNLRWLIPWNPVFHIHVTCLFSLLNSINSPQFLFYLFIVIFIFGCYEVGRMWLTSSGIFYFIFLERQMWHNYFVFNYIQYT